jgi:hypothetical protein
MPTDKNEKPAIPTGPDHDAYRRVIQYHAENAKERAREQHPEIIALFDTDPGHAEVLAVDAIKAELRTLKDTINAAEEFLCDLESERENRVLIAITGLLRARSQAFLTECTVRALLPADIALTHPDAEFQYLQRDPN